MMENTHLDDIQLYEYASDELDPAERAAAEQHLASCGECSSMLALAQAGSETLRAAPRFELPPAALERALGSLGPQDSEPSPGRGRFSMQRWLSVLAPVAAVAGVVVVVIFAVRGGDESDSTSAAPAPAEPAAEVAAAEPAERAAQAAPPAEEQALDTATADKAGGSESAAEMESGSAPTAGSSVAEPQAEPEPPADQDPAAVVEVGPPPASAEPAPPGEPFANGSAPLAQLAGPAEEIVDLLAQAGITAVVADDGGVEVIDADADAALEALALREKGEVPLRVTPEAVP